MQYSFIIFFGSEAYFSTNWLERGERGTRNDEAERGKKRRDRGGEETNGRIVILV